MSTEKKILAKVLLPDCRSGNSDRAKYASTTGGWYEHVRDQATPSLPSFSFLLGISLLLFADFNGEPESRHAFPKAFANHQGQDCLTDAGKCIFSME